MAGDEAADRRTRDKAANPSAPESPDELSPTRVLREQALSSRSERQGNNTPTGPASSPPVDPEVV